MFSRFPPALQGQVKQVAESPETIYDYKPGEQKLIEKAVRTAYPGWQRPRPPGLFNDDDARFAAQQAAAGDKSVFAGLGRGIQGSENIVKVRRFLREILTAKGLNGFDQAAAIANFNAEARAAASSAVREANVQSSLNEAANTFPLLVEASKNVPRSDFVPLNQLEQLVRSKTGSVAQGRLLVALQGAKIAYSQAMSRTGVNSVHAQQAADHLFDGITSHDVLLGKMEQAQLEMKAAHEAPEQTRKAILARISGRTEQPAAAPAPAVAPAGGGGAPKRVTNPAEAQQAVDEARAAIAKGVPRAKVLQRLREMGVPIGEQGL